MKYLLLLSFLFLSSGYAKHYIIIDPGHGGKDPGTVNGLTLEKKIALTVSNLIIKELKKKGIKNIISTRHRDLYVSLDRRIAIANRYNNSTFVSIHFNGSTNKNIKGIEIFYASKKGRKIAKILLTNLLYKTKFTSRGLKKVARYKVLNKTKSPAVLLELGFLSNNQEKILCKNPTYQKKMARAIADGITYYLREVKNVR